VAISSFDFIFFVFIGFLVQWWKYLADTEPTLKQPWTFMLTRGAGVPHRPENEISLNLTQSKKTASPNK
jgi:hypothetical protein